MSLDDRENELNHLRQSLQRGESATQGQLDDLGQVWEDRIKPSGKDREVLLLVDSKGRFLEPRLEAPRWLCHLFGLRHRCAHVVLRWSSPSMGKTYVLQVRGWDKDCLPGYLDTAVGGHITGERSAEQTAYQEMKEELGLVRDHLLGRDLVYVGSYEIYDEYEENLYFCDAQWHEVYLGDVVSLDAIQFEDGEVVGVYLCPEPEIGNLLQQPYIPVAYLLEHILPDCVGR